MSTLERLRLLRAHLVRHWAVADEWAVSPIAFDGSPCLVLVADDGCSMKHWYGSDDPYGEGNTLVMEREGKDGWRVFPGVCDAIGGCPLGVLQRDGKDVLLQNLSRAIARLEEHEVAWEGNGGSRPGAMGSSIGQHPAQRPAQAVPRRAENTSVPSHNEMEVVRCV